MHLKAIVATPGDADLSGHIDFDDYVRIDTGFNTGLTGWENGDFNGSGAVDFDDYVLIDVNFNTQNGGRSALLRAQRWLSGEDRSDVGMDTPAMKLVEEHMREFGIDYANAFVAAVPEPTGIAIGTLIFGACSAHRRRR